MKRKRQTVTSACCAGFIFLVFQTGFLANGSRAQEDRPAQQAEVVSTAEVANRAEVAAELARSSDDSEDPFLSAKSAESVDASADSSGALESSAERPGRRIRIPLPIVGNGDVVAKQTIQRIVQQFPQSNPRPVLVLEFWPQQEGDANDNRGAGSEFERCLSLARFLTSPEMEAVKTVAFIPRQVVGHAVLPALACEQLIMDADAILGDAGDGDQNIGATVRASYVEIARSRRTLPEAIALGMLDSELQVDRVTTAQGVLYVWPEELVKLRETRNDIQAIDTIIRAGERGRFRGDELRRLGFVSYLASTPQEVATLLNVNPAHFEFDPSIGGEWKAIRVELNGPVTPQSVERVMRTIDQQREQRGVNFVCLEIESPGGAPDQSLRLANYLADLDPAKVRTVVYVPHEARGDAMLVAFAADHLVAHPDAILGGGGATWIDETTREDLRVSLRPIAERKGRSWSLVDAMLNSDTIVYRYTASGSQRVKYLCEDEFNETLGANAQGAASDAAAWVRGDAITEPGKPLQFDGRDAESIDFVRYLAENLSQVQQLYQLESQPELIGPNWAFELVDALASPKMAGILLFVGGAALIMEMSSPGIGVGGFVAACCYLLFFWSNLLHGTAEVLEVLLFLMGVVCIVLEVLVIPGFGIFGLGGGAMVLLSFVLASQTFVFPTNDYQWQEFSQSLTTVMLAGIGVFATLLLLRKNIHRAPFLRRVVLLPPSGEELELRSQREITVNYESLLGHNGVTRTQLIPSGKATFGDKTVDVMSEGEMIERGVRVQVVQARGNRVIVRPCEDPTQ